jgi:transcriptional regulator with XRE-family HTH domain
MDRIDPNELAVFIGSRIRERREYMERSLEEVGGAIGVKRANMSKIELGQVKVGAVDLALLAKYLKVRVEYFYGEVDQSSLDSDLLRSLPEEMRAIATDFLRVLHEHAEKTKS